MGRVIQFPMGDEAPVSENEFIDAVCAEIPVPEGLDLDEFRGIVTQVVTHRPELPKSVSVTLPDTGIDDEVLAHELGRQLKPFWQDYETRWMVRCVKLFVEQYRKMKWG